jgi:hypothetical protein
MFYFLVVQFFTLAGKPLGEPIVDTVHTMEECQRAKGLYERILVEQGQATKVVKVYCYNREEYNVFVKESLAHVD